MLHSAFAMAAVVIVCLWWCYYIIRRLPSDIAEIRENGERYRTRNDPAILEGMRTEERRELYRRRCANEYWTTLGVQILFFWPVTLVFLLFLVYFVISRIRLFF